MHSLRSAAVQYTNYGTGGAFKLPTQSGTYIYTLYIYIYIIYIYIHVYISRHTIMCRAAQEAGAPHREYINRKKENAIFTPM